jgi:hypothetical protein
MLSYAIDALEGLGVVYLLFKQCQAAKAPVQVGHLTAREYLEQYEPGVIDLMLDPDAALHDDTNRAARIAAECSNPGSRGAAFPVSVWRQVYP